ncbi:class I SAM-dependent methyltransferase [Candidatus Pacearchaeota archaeon]|nr:class I SAM-dependent methyltransferase [Candidatus Pacearchaeota archaeon]
MDYKAETKKSYNKYTEEFSRKFDEHFKNFVMEEADIFLRHLKGKRILDIGAGPGIHSEYFRARGYNSLCIDISEEMVKLCKSKGLESEVMDAEDLQLDETFDGIWAYTVLLHIKKSNVPSVIKKISELLKPKGIFGLALKEGVGEEFKINDKYPGTQRWFSYFTEEEVKILYDKHFELLHLSKTHTSHGIFANYILRKK